MKNSIKKMLIEKSNNTEIKDLSESIISKVDTSKVVSEPEFDFMPKTRKTLLRNPITYLSVLCACLLAFVIQMYFFLDNNSSQEEPDDYYTDIVLTQDLVTETYAYQVNSLSNIVAVSVPSPMTAMSYKNLTVQEKEGLTVDLNSYCYDISEMMGVTSITPTLYEVENNEYKYKLVVNRESQPSITFYYNEQLIGVKNEGKDNYKCDSNLSGMIYTGGNTYAIEGSRRNEGDGTVIFNMTVTLPTGSSYDSITVSSKLEDDIEKITYSYVKDKNVSKKIYIENRPNVKLSFQVSYPLNAQTRTLKIEFTREGDNLIVGKIKDSNGDYVSIIYENGIATTTFGNYKN